MTLVSTYDPSSQAQCPTCGKLVHCQNTGGLLLNSINDHMDFYHDVCNTEWRMFLRQDKKPEILNETTNAE